MSAISPPKEIPDDAEDSPVSGRRIGPLPGSLLGLPQIIMGCATFGPFYNSDDSYLSSDTPARTVRLALRYGMAAFDTSAYYGHSEIVLGHALKAIESEYPRSSYSIMTKCGRYLTHHDYAPETIRRTVMDSLARLQTDYLDVVYVHDVEFVCAKMPSKQSGNHISALGDEAAAYGLGVGDETKVRGPGDELVLGAVWELQKLKEEGIIRRIGISGYPLPTLLRLAILVLHTSPFKPLDVILSYSHLTLQNSTLEEFAPHFQNRAQVQQLVNASPYSMGLLALNAPPSHPAPAALLAIAKKAGEACNLTLPDVAAGYSIRKSKALGMPLVVGFSNVQEVHEFMKSHHDIDTGVDKEKRSKDEEDALRVFSDAGYLDWSWSHEP